jgi:hypothetical protein
MDDTMLLDDPLIDVDPALPAAEPSPRRFRRSRKLLKRVGRALGSAFGWVFGLVSLVLGLSILASLPILQFLSLGYLLDSSARVARSGRLRDGFIGVRLAGRIGESALRVCISMIPLCLALI